MNGKAFHKKIGSSRLVQQFFAFEKKKMTGATYVNRFEFMS